MDYRSALIDSINHANKNATPWEWNAVKIATSVMQDRVESGPVSALQAINIVAAMPLYYALATPHLTTALAPEERYVAPVPSAAGGGLLLTKKDVAQEISKYGAMTGMVPDTRQGMKSWYTCFINLQAGGVKQTAPVSVIVSLYQTAVNASAGIGGSAWAIVMVTVNPTTGEWFQEAFAQTLDADQVRVFSTRVVIQAPGVAGFIEPSSNGGTIDINFRNLGACKCTFRSAMGPVLHAHKGVITNDGPLQTRRWSIVDGIVAAGASLSGTENTWGAKPYVYASGGAWLDFQQYGLAKLEPLERLLACSMPPRSIVQSWLEVNIQTPTQQIYAKVHIRANRMRPDVLRGTCTVWSSSGGKYSVRYEVPLKIHIADSYPALTPPTPVLNASTPLIPRIVQMYVHDVEYVLTARNKTAPPATSFLVNASPLYSIPCTVNELNPATARAVMQWLPPSITTAQLIRHAGLPARFNAANKASETAIVASILGMFTILTAIAAASAAAITAVRNT